MCRGKTEGDGSGMQAGVGVDCERSNADLVFSMTAPAAAHRCPPGQRQLCMRKKSHARLPPPRLLCSFLSRMAPARPVPDSSRTTKQNYRPNRAGSTHALQPRDQDTYHTYAQETGNHATRSFWV